MVSFPGVQPTHFSDHQFDAGLLPLRSESGKPQPNVPKEGGLIVSPPWFPPIAVPVVPPGEICKGGGNQKKQDFLRGIEKEAQKDLKALQEKIEEAVRHPERDPEALNEMRTQESLLSDWLARKDGPSFQDCFECKPATRLEAKLTKTPVQ